MLISQHTRLLAARVVVVMMARVRKHRQAKSKSNKENRYVIKIKVMRLNTDGGEALGPVSCALVGFVCNT